MEIVFDNVKYVINKKQELEKTLLNDVSFEINKNGIYSFLGASNSGKTAVGELIATLAIPTSGTVKIGRYKNNGSKYGLKTIRSKIGFVYKNPYDMFFNKTVYEELIFGMKEFKYKVKDTKRVNDALNLVNLNESILNDDPLSLDLVSAKKLALACILIYNPEIIILDEYTSGLSTSDKKDLIRLLKMLKNKYKKTIILLSKDTSFSYEVTDYVYIMNLTRIVHFGSKSLLEDKELLKENDLEVPKIVEFIDECNKHKHDISYNNNILDLIKEVYRDVY